MALPGETIASGAPPICPECGEDALATLAVREGGAGFFIGTACACGPFDSRESGFYRTREQAEKALKTETYGR